MKKINCGGFYINEDNFEITDDGELKLKSGSGGSSGILVCPLEYTGTVIRATMKASDLFDADVVIFSGTDSSASRDQKTTGVCTEMASYANGSYSFEFVFAGLSLTLEADTGDDYPEAEPEVGPGPGTT